MHLGRAKCAEKGMEWDGLASKKDEEALGLAVLASNPFQSQSILLKMETLNSEPLPFFPAEIMFISRNI